MRIRTAQKFINFYAMKKVHKFLLRSVASLFALAFNPVVNAQDDLYFNPATDASAPTVAKYTEEYDANNNVTRTYNDNDEYYEDDNDYAYEYSSRIRRFQHHAVVVDYYDPFYIDLYNYDPFYSPGTSIYVYNYNDYWSYRQWRRYQRWNSWDNYNYRFGGGWNSWGWQSSYSYNTPWYNPWVVNNYYYDPYWTCNGYNPYYQNNYYGNGWSNDHYYYNSHNGNGGNSSGYSPKTYTGPRRHGSNVNPGYARITDSKGRLATAENNVPTIEKTAARPGRTVDDIEGNTAVGRGKTASDRSAAPSAGGRRPQGSTTEPLSRTRNSEVPTGRNVETPAPRTNDGYQPRRLETAPAPRTNEGYKRRHAAVITKVVAFRRVVQRQRQPEQKKVDQFVVPKNAHMSDLPVRTTMVAAVLLRKAIQSGHQIVAIARVPAMVETVVAAHAVVIPGVVKIPGIVVVAVAVEAAMVAEINTATNLDRRAEIGADRLFPPSFCPV
jgi:hypothetical protein